MNAQSKSTADLKIVGPTGRFPKVTLVDPTTSSYLIFALEIDHRLPVTYFLESHAKKAAIVLVKAAAKRLDSNPDVIDATVFKTLIAPPGRGDYLKQRPNVPIARFDLVMLVELSNNQAAQALRSGAEWTGLMDGTAALARKSLVLSMTNARQIGPVDHSRDGVFLFNYFYADDLGQNLAVWNYTAGWFQDQTGLDNSTLLVPDTDQGADYTVINHCRWDRLRDIIPALFRHSFKTYVEDNFTANRTAPIPILYRLA